MIKRFTGACELLAPVNASGLIDWIRQISFEEWPQQNRLADGKLRPAMVSDPAWHGFGKASDPIVTQVMNHFPGCRPYQRMLSVVMPGHSIEPHLDWQAPDWVCRVHVPLASNDASFFSVARRVHSLCEGMAYRVNTEAEHSVTNDGDTPRIHFMWDVRNDA